MFYIILMICILPACITMFAYHSKRKREFPELNSRETLSYSLQHDDEFYSVKRSKSALKKHKSTCSSRKSVQFNEVVLEVFDLVNEDEPEDFNHKPSCPKIVKSSLKNEKIYVPIRCSNTIFPKTIINEYNGEIININKDEEGKEESKQEKQEDTNSNEFPEIVIIKANEEKSSTVLSQININNDDKENNSLSLPSQISNTAATTVITSEAKPETNLSNIKTNTLPRRSRPNHKGHRRTSSVRLTCIY